MEDGPTLAARAAIYSAGGFPGAHRPPRVPTAAWPRPLDSRPAGLSSEGLAVASRGSGGTVQPRPFESGRSAPSSAASPASVDAGAHGAGAALYNGYAGSPSDLIGQQKVAWDANRVRQRTPSPSSAAGSDVAGVRSGPGAEDRRGRQRAEPVGPASGHAGAPSERMSQWAPNRGRQSSPAGQESLENKGAANQWAPTNPLRKWPAFEPKPRHPSPAAPHQRHVVAAAEANNARGGASRAPRASTPNARNAAPPPQLFPDPPSPVASASERMMPSAPASPTAGLRDSPGAAGAAPLLAAAAPPAPAAPSGQPEMGPDAVVQWLGSMASCIPSQILAELRHVISTRNITGPAFAACLTAFKVEALEVENLSPMHLSRLRKAWFADFPRQSYTADQLQWHQPSEEDSGYSNNNHYHSNLSQQQHHHHSQRNARQPPPFATPFATPMQGFPGHPSQQDLPGDGPSGYSVGAEDSSYPMYRQGSHGHDGDGRRFSQPAPQYQQQQQQPWPQQQEHANTPQQAALLASVVDCLAAWAGFDRHDAMRELAHAAVLPPQLQDDVAVELQRRAPMQRSQHLDEFSAPFLDTFGPCRESPDGALRPNMRSASPPDDVVVPACASKQQQQHHQRVATPSRQASMSRRPSEAKLESPVAAHDATRASAASTATGRQHDRTQKITAQTRGGGGGGGGGAGGAARDAAYVAAWVRSLPNSQVPEAEREALAASVEEQNVDGTAFTRIVANAGSLAELGVPAPARAMKLKKAWDQVLREDACKAVAMESASANRSCVGKGVRCM